MTSDKMKLLLTKRDVIVKHGIPYHKNFDAALQQANDLLQAGGSLSSALELIRNAKPQILAPRTAPVDLFINTSADTPYEKSNLQDAISTIEPILHCPKVISATFLPDVCPAGPVGSMPVGSVVVSRAIHPNMHSADICCSVFLSKVSSSDPKELLDNAYDTTHFGPSPKGSFKVSKELEEAILSNRFTRPLIDLANSHLASQGDGNHFTFVGHSEATGELCMVTHMGTRGFGAALYKEGLAAAKKHCKNIYKDLTNAWMSPEDEQDYWEALQIARMWAKENHQLLHSLAAGETITEQFWNEHNFVFKRDNLYYHAKGATPAFKGWASDATSRTLIPLNMASPILVTEGADNPDSLGFAPHGAGRLLSRSAFTRSIEGYSLSDYLQKVTAGIDVRFYSGTPDLSELPPAYKDAQKIEDEINHFGLATVVDRILPYGSIMAGEIYAPWKKQRTRTS